MAMKAAESAKRQRPTPAESVQSKRPKTTAAKMLMCNVIVRNDSSGNPQELMQPVPIIRDASFPLTIELLERFGLGDAELRKRVLFFFTYIVGLCEGSVREGLRHLFIGMQKSVEIHFTAKNQLLDATANYNDLTREYNSVVDENKLLTQTVSDLRRESTAVLTRLEVELANTHHALEKAETDKAALENEILILEKKHQSDIGVITAENISMDNQIRSLRKESQTFSSIKESINTEISKIREIFTDFIAKTNADISALSSQFSEFQAQRNAEDESILSELSILRTRSNR